jgi:hypothetical protein
VRQALEGVGLGAPARALLAQQVDGRVALTLTREDDAALRDEMGTRPRPFLVPGT